MTDVVNQLKTQESSAFRFPNKLHDIFAALQRARGGYSWFRFCLMASAFEFTLNGRSIRVSDVSPNTTLLEYLHQLRAHRLKEGCCAEGDCGACSVAIIERGADGKPTYRAVNSCIMPVCCLVAGREVVTVEGVGCSAKQHPVQQRWSSISVRNAAIARRVSSARCSRATIAAIFTRTTTFDEQLAGNLLPLHGTGRSAQRRRMVHCHRASRNTGRRCLCRAAQDG